MPHIPLRTKVTDDNKQKKLAEALQQCYRLVMRHKEIVKLCGAAGDLDKEEMIKHDFLTLNLKTSDPQPV